MDFGRVELKATTFIQTIDKWKELEGKVEITKLAYGLLEDMKYIEELKLEAETDISSENRLENVLELINVISEYETQEENASLQEFLENISLVADSDEIEDDNYVTLMTIHTSKGLEYPVVFLVALEEGIFPSQRAIEEEDGIEEERRLCYVATTRARQKLYISFTERRSMYGKSQSTLNSRFVDEITDKSAIKKTIEKKNYDNKFDSKYSDGSGYSYNYNEFGNYEKKSSSANFDFLTADKFLQNLEKNKGQKEHDKVAVGDRVLHSKFGKGTIQNIIEQDDKILDILFDNGQRKKLYEEFAGIKKIDE